MDFTVLPKVLSSITLFQWQSSNLGKRTFKRSKIVDIINIENSLADGMKLMHESYSVYGMFAIANKERTQIQATLSTREVLQYMVKNYNGDLSVFRRTKLDSYQHQTLVRTFKDDKLIELLF